MQVDRPGPKVVDWLGVRYTTILSAAETGGTLSIFESVSPVGSGPPRHVHDREDEAFVILSGRCEFWLDGRTSTREAGEAAMVPRGIEHAFRVIGDAPSRHLTILTPGGFEGFFAEMAQGGFRIPEDMGQVAASAARYSMRFTGPPLGAA